MPELNFVLKSLAIAVVVTICLQVKVGSATLENHAYQWMRTSSVPHFVEDVSSGAVLAIRNAAKASSDFVGKTFGHDSSLQRAGRLNFDFKRSPQYEQEHTNQDH
jgi:hypothetical protein